jgi:hypothetical protein
VAAPTTTGARAANIRRDISAKLECVSEAADNARTWHCRRNGAIVAAIAAGASAREVARAAGLTHTAIQRIVKRALDTSRVAP